ncbi:MAG: PEP-CTERM sorting domain-containing protein [Rubrivivax sp.]|nr:PEP-CTERM sorting domain-containing protein [Rubrivivax sp.]
MVRYLAALPLLLGGAAQAQATFYFEASTPYLSAADIPAGFYAGDAPGFLDTLEDDSLDGGLSGSAGGVIGAEDWGSYVDSVAADSPGIGRSWFNINGVGGVSFSFTGPVLPTAFGLVVTDASGPVTFSAFDALGASLGEWTRTGFQDAGSNGGTAEDRFFGVTSAGGIASIKVTSAGGGLELDHLQYGQMVAAVPEPGSWALLLAGLGATALRLRPRAR